LGIAEREGYEDIIELLTKYNEEKPPTIKEPEV
jgi:hypothetical protein